MPNSESEVLKAEHIHSSDEPTEYEQRLPVALSTEDRLQNLVNRAQWEAARERFERLSADAERAQDAAATAANKHNMFLSGVIAKYSLSESDYWDNDTGKITRVPVKATEPERPS